MTPARYRKLRRVLDRRQPDLTVLTENVHKSHNISAILRTADAVGIYEAHAVSEGGEVPRHHMASAGSRKWVEIRAHRDLASAIRHLKSAGHQILAAHFSDSAKDFRAVDYTEPTAVLLGSELWGVSHEAAKLSDHHIVIPMEGMVASLNVSVATALILYEAQRQRQKAGLYEQRRLNPDVYERKLFEWCYPEVAEKLRQEGRPYPELDEEGYLAAGSANGAD